MSKSNDKLAGLADTDKLAARSKKFGIPAKEQQTEKQVGHVNLNVTTAQRLGIPVKAADDKLLARKARFGTQRYFCCCIGVVDYVCCLLGNFCGMYTHVGVHAGMWLSVVYNFLVVVVLLKA